MLSGEAIFGVKLQDDVSAAAKATVTSVAQLRENLDSLVSNFKESRKDVKALSVTMMDARKIWQSSGQSISLFKAALKDAGVSVLDTKLLVGKMTQELRDQRKEALGMTSTWSRIFDPKTVWAMSHALNVVSKGLGAIGTVAGATYGAISKVGGMAYDAGKSLMDSVIDSAQFRENTLTSMKYMLETSEGLADGKAKANEIFRYAQQMATETPLDTTDIIDTVRDLMTARFNSDEAMLMTKFVADQATKFKSNPAMRQNTVNFLARVKGRGYATNEDLGDSARAAGLSTTDITKSLAKRLGITAGDDLKLAEKVRKELSKAANVGSYTFLNAVIESVEKGNSVLGSFAKDNSESLSGVISNFKASFGDLISSVELDKWPGVTAFKAFLGRIVDALKPGAETGKALLTTVQGITDSVLSGLNGITNKDIERFITTVGDVAKFAIKMIQEAWRWLDKLVHNPKDLPGMLKDSLIEVGTFIGMGLLRGIGTGVAGAVNTFGESVTDKVNVFKYLAPEAESYYQTEGGGGPGVRVPINGKRALGGPVGAGSSYLVGENGPELFMPNMSGRVMSHSDLVKGAGRGGGNVYHVSVPVSVMGNVSDPDGLARALEPVIISGLTSALERLNNEYGA